MEGELSSVDAHLSWMAAALPLLNDWLTAVFLASTSKGGAKIFEHPEKLAASADFHVCGLSAKVGGLSASVLIVFAWRHVLAFLGRCLRLRVVVRRVLCVASHAPRPQCNLLL